MTDDAFTPATQAELARFVAENARGARRPLYPVGGRTMLGYGYPLAEAGVKYAVRFGQSWRSGGNDDSTMTC